MIQGHRAIVTAIHDSGSRASVKYVLANPPIPSRPLPVFCSPGVVGSVRVGDEVFIMESGSGLQDACILGWWPSPADRVAALDVLYSPDGGPPISHDPGNPVTNVAMDTTLKVRP